MMIRYVIPARSCTANLEGRLFVVGSCDVRARLSLPSRSRSLTGTWPRRSSTSSGTTLFGKNATALADPMLSFRNSTKRYKFCYYSTNMDRLGLGSTKWNRMNPQQYVEIVSTALQNGITVLEAGPEGGDQALCDAVRQYLSKANNQEIALARDKPLEIVLRVGYRLQRKIKPAAENVDGEGILVEDKTADELEGVPPGNDPNRPPFLALEDDIAQKAGESGEDYAVHNISPAYLEYAIESSPILKLKNELTAGKIKFSVLLHNPEVQQNPSTMEEKLVQAFSKLEGMDQVDSYGVSSNGLCLPKEHPLHLDYETLLKAAQRVLQTKSRNESSSTDSCKFRVVQLPVNALETVGVRVAQQMHEYVRAYNQRARGSDGNKLNLEIYSMRPLTCYPDQGTGTGRPFLLTDYQMPATMEKKLAWTNEMAHAPQAYDVALKMALHHFDAESLIEKKQAGEEELTPEERETLDGCKLMQSVLHDLDVGLEKVRSFAAHEDTLYRQVIPVIQDTFESYDEDTARVLQSFFGAYNMAVRYHVAKNTRHLLRHGESSSSSGRSDQQSNAVTYTAEELPESKRLQEFALEFVLKQNVGSDVNRPAIDKVILGFSQPVQVVSAVEIVREYQEKDNEDR